MCYKVLFTGHSAGGQLAWRMAMLNQCDVRGTDGIRARELGTEQIQFKYVPQSECNHASSKS